MHAQVDPDNPLQGYFDWQITTLMLAYDLVDPIPAEHKDAAHERREKVEREVRQLSLKQVPQELQDDPQRDWPPAVLRDITRATLRRAVEIVQVGATGDTAV